MKPMVMLYKLEDAFFLRYEKEKIYQKILSILNNVKSILPFFSFDHVLFFSKIGFCFHLDNFSRKLTKNLNLKPHEISKRLFGDHFFNEKTKQWSCEKKENFERGFNLFILKPIDRVFKICFLYTKYHKQVDNFIEKFKIKTERDFRLLKPKEKINVLLMGFLPIENCLKMMLENFAPVDVHQNLKYYKYFNLQSPFNNLVLGDVRKCDPKGNTVILIIKEVLDDANSKYFFGKIMSGTVKVGQKFQTNNGEVDEIKSVFFNPNFEFHISEVACGNFSVFSSINSRFSNGDTLTEPNAEFQHLKIEYHNNLDFFYDDGLELFCNVKFKIKEF
eukprot:gene1679-448_t